MAKNVLLDCVSPTDAIEYLIKASNLTRNSFFAKAKISHNSGYNVFKDYKTISSENWYKLISRLPEPMYQLYLKLITRVHKDTELKGTLPPDPFLFYSEKEMTPHRAVDVLVYFTKVYDLSVDEIAYHTEIPSDTLRQYFIYGTYNPRLDRLWNFLSALPFNLVLDFEWVMRNVHVNTPLSNLQYTKVIPSSEI